MPVVISAGRRDVAGKQMVQQQILEGLFVGYAIDSKHTISYIPQELFDSWKISIDDLHEVALENLVTKSAVLQAQAVPDDPSISLYLDDDFTGEIRKLAEPSPAGGIVIGSEVGRTVGEVPAQRDRIGLH